jgi:branched-chain amino acid transport system permease protein
MTTLFTILFDGIAYGMLLFVLSCGLAVTLGLMNFVNLAHGAFAMAGGYVCAVIVNGYGVPFFAALPVAFLASALLGAVMERGVYRYMYGRSHLDQVLFTVGLVFMSVAAVDYIMGSTQVFVKLPDWLHGQINIFGVGDVAGKYYVPKLGAFVIYAMMIVLLLWRPHGLFGRTAAR